ncbi:hypothetical protein AUJ14_01510 [Candidatus Micrarchaeota archaeon CG1_02_55_22]|nr:MAG: hypothetical protein AUJ14_01510 [Candidatus Micrarchaeota archaeon CG1_02_55_22]
MRKPSFAGTVEEYAPRAAIALALLAIVLLLLSLVPRAPVPARSVVEVNTSTPVPIVYVRPSVLPASDVWSELYERVAPSEGAVLPVTWGRTGPALITSGALNFVQFVDSMNRSSRPLTMEQANILLSGSGENVSITRENKLFVLEFFWALGLVNNNSILFDGPLSHSESVSIDRFASTGGWRFGNQSVAQLVGSANILRLSSMQQALVENVSKSVYRPCCNNPTYFPDCNHGMAALGLIEFMAYQNASREQILSALLYANSYWFPDNYLDLAEYFKEQGVSWEDVDAGLVLSAEYSSASGYRNISSQLARKPVLGTDATSC